MSVVQNQTLTRDDDNTIDLDTEYFDLNTKANTLADDLVAFAEDIAVDVEAWAGTKSAALDAKVDEVMSVNPDGTYYTKDALDNKLAIPSAAEFEALAAKRRDEYAGSGFVEWGLSGVAGASIGTVNQGMWCWNTAENYFLLGSDTASVGYGSRYPKVVVNGHTLYLKYLAYLGANKVFLPAAPATSALLDRQDLVFLEAWHEDIAEKGVVYPYGNIQYGATSYACPDGTSLTCAAGTFDGYGTYSLFGNWQSSGDLIGKGIVWANMTDAQKQSFAADPENNLYLDGDKIIQVRYRIRVVEGLGSDWANVSNTLNPLAYSSDVSQMVKPKGHLTNIAKDIDISTGGYFMGAENSGNNIPNVRIGVWVKEGSGSFAYGEKCFALPICLVHRRNSGAFHPVWNPNGARGWRRYGVTRSDWYHAHFNGLVDLDDAFYNPTATDELGYDDTSGMIGGDTGSGRPDELYYDEVNEADILDLRNSAHKVEDFQRLLERELNKCVAGTMRGWENAKKVEIQDKGDTSGMRFRYSANFNYTTTKYHNNTWPSDVYRGVGCPIFITDALYSDVAVFILAANTDDGTGLLASFWLSDGAAFPVNTSSIDTILKTRLTLTTLFDDGTYYRSYNELRVINLIDIQASSKTLLQCDIIGDPANYYRGHYDFTSSEGSQTIALDDVVRIDTLTTGSGTVGNFYQSLTNATADLEAEDFTDTEKWTDLGADREDSWITNGVMGTPLLVGEDSVSFLYPTTTNTNTIKLSRKAVGAPVLVLYSDNAGVTWQNATTWAISTGFSTTTNTLGSSSTSGILYLVFYLTAASPMELASNAEVFALGDVWAGKNETSALGCDFVANLVGKVPVGGTDPDYLSVLPQKVGVAPATSKLPVWSVYSPAHDVLSLGGSGTPAVKALSYLTRENGKAFLQLLYKELIYDADWGDDSKFNVVDNESTTTDDNGNTVKIGQKRIELPYFISDGD